MKNTLVSLILVLVLVVASSAFAEDAKVESVKFNGSTYMELSLNDAIQREFLTPSSSFSFGVTCAKEDISLDGMIYPTGEVHIFGPYMCGIWFATPVWKGYHEFIVFLTTPDEGRFYVRVIQDGYSPELVIRDYEPDNSPLIFSK